MTTLTIDAVAAVIAAYGGDLAYTLYEVREGAPAYAVPHRGTLFVYSGASFGRGAEPSYTYSEESLISPADALFQAFRSAVADLEGWRAINEQRDRAAA